MVSNRENPENHPIYSIDTDLGSSMLFNEVGPQKDEPKPADSGGSESDYQGVGTDLDSEFDNVPITQELSDGWWHMSFDGAANKRGEGAGISIRPPIGEPKLLSYKLNFKCTNNVAEYEALILGLKALKDLQSQRVDIKGDSKFVIRQVQGSYQAKHPRMKSYRNLVLDLMGDLKNVNILLSPEVRILRLIL